MGRCRCTGLLRQVPKKRALRCEGFNLTDLHRNDEAVKQYDAALKLNPNDEISKRELEYIRQQRPETAPSSSS